MEPQSVIPLEALEQAHSPWPRILKMIAGLGLLFALCALFNGVISFYWLVKPPGARITYAYAFQWKTAATAYALLALCRAFIALLMLIATVRLWRRAPRSYLLLMMAARLWIAVWLLQVAVQLFYGRRSALEYVPSYLLHGIIAAAFPILSLLILREYSSDHSQPSGSAPAPWAIPPPGHTPLRR